MGSKSRATFYGASVRAAAERATEARKESDRLACEAWNKRMLGFQGPAPSSPASGDAPNAGYRYLEAKCLGCNTHQTVALDIVRRPKTTPIHELERYMRCKDCSEVRGYAYKRSHLVALLDLPGLDRHHRRIGMMQALNRQGQETPAPTQFLGLRRLLIARHAAKLEPTRRREPRGYAGLKLCS